MEFQQMPKLLGLKIYHTTLYLLFMLILSHTLSRALHFLLLYDSTISI